MLIFLGKLLFVGIIFMLTDFISYKIIRIRDIKERKKIDKYEIEQVDRMIEKINELKESENESNI